MTHPTFPESNVNPDNERDFEKLFWDNELEDAVL